MRFLNWNHRKVQNLTPWEIWAFIVGRVLVGFGFGILFTQWYPQIADSLALPVLIIGFIILIFAARGFRRKEAPKI